jgi:hypothetical protein
MMSQGTCFCLVHCSDPCLLSLLRRCFCWPPCLRLLVCLHIVLHVLACLRACLLACSPLPQGPAREAYLGTPFFEGGRGSQALSQLQLKVGAQVSARADSRGSGLGLGGQLPGQKASGE